MERLASSKGAWAAASLAERIAVLKEIRSRLLEQVGLAVQCALKG